MQQLVECVPNFSEGRDAAVYTAIADAIRSVRAVNVLDVSADPDHNRTVVTFMGKPADVEEAAFRGISKAAEHINLDYHEGEHPRIGATDVCPFIPIRGVSVEDCVALANRLGQRVGPGLCGARIPRACSARCRVMGRSGVCARLLAGLHLCDSPAKSDWWRKRFLGGGERGGCRAYRTNRRLAHEDDRRHRAY